MQHVLFRALASAGAFSALLSCNLYAGEPVPRAPEVVVTATRFPADEERLPIGVTVVSAADIRNSAARTVPELLGQLAGIRVRDTGNPNFQVDMRGFGSTGDQNTLVLVDGQRVSENEQTTVNWSAIPLEAVERIEILYGSGAVLYGGGATGGTINIITKSPSAQRSQVTLGGGVASYNTLTGSAAFNYAGENFEAAAIGTYENGNGYRDNNSFRNRSALADLRWGNSRNGVSLKLGGNDQAFGLPGAISQAQIAANPRQALFAYDNGTLATGYANLGGNVSVGDADLAANLTYRQRVSHGRFFLGTAFGPSLSDAQSDVWTFAPRVRLPFSAGGVDQVVIGGVDWENWNYQATNSTPAFGILNVPEGFQRSLAGYAQYTARFATATTLSAGGRIQRTDYGASNPVPAFSTSQTPTLSAWELAARQDVGKGVSLLAKAGFSFRLPNINDNFNIFTGAINLLQPQKSHQQELGTEWNGGAYGARIALYNIETSNEIHLNPFTGNNVNLPPTRRRGVEISGRANLGESVTVSANYTYADSEFVSGAVGGVPLAGNEVPLVPRNAANASITWRALDRLRLSGQVSYVGQQRFDSDETNTFNQMMPAYTVVDLKAVYEIKTWLLTAGIKNLFDEKYFSYGVFTGFPTFSAYPSPQRNFFMTAQYAFR
ncbi:MAG: TonB-dependent receptor [Burkholderiales bacterium]